MKLSRLEILMTVKMSLGGKSAWPWQITNISGGRTEYMFRVEVYVLLKHFYVLTIHIS
jgi:hypothetical protein